MINREALEMIKNWEGCKLTAYPDPGSKNGLPWTIGYGHTKDVKKGDKIEPEQAEAFLIEDLKVAEAVIKKYITVELNENQYGALASFIHNIGEAQFVKGSVDNLINSGQLDKVPAKMAEYRLNDGKVMQGLINRRKDEGNLWSKPVVKPPTLPQVKEEGEGMGHPSSNLFLWLLSLLWGLIVKVLKK